LEGEINITREVVKEKLLNFRINKETRKIKTKQAKLQNRKKTLHTGDNCGDNLINTYYPHLTPHFADIIRILTLLFPFVLIFQSNS